MNQSLNSTKTLNIAYITNTRFPTERGQGVQIARNIDSLQLHGHKVTLIVPSRKQTSQIQNISNLKKWYDLSTNIAIKYINVPQPHHSKISRLTFWLSSLLFTIKCTFLLKQLIPDLIYTRDDFIAGIFGFLRYKTFYEGHFEPEKGSWGHVLFLKFASGVISNTKALHKRYQLLGINRKKLLYLPNGVKSSWLKQKPTQSLRKRFKLTPKQKLVVYAGNLYHWKGVNILAKATRYLPSHIQVIIIGGLKEDQKQLRDLIKSIRSNQITLVPHQSQSKLVSSLASADVLILPNSSKDIHSKHYTAPLKLFEYMALRKPVVASKIPSLQSLVTRKEVIFVKPDDPQALADGIKIALTQNQTKHIHQAFKLASQHTWEKRAAKLTQFLTAKIL